MRCHACSFEAPEGDRFCENCGGSLGAADGAVAPAAAAAAVSIRLCVCGSNQFEEGGACSDCGRIQHPEIAVQITQIDDTLAWATHPGKHHIENQDAAAVGRLPCGGAVLAVADGVSSANHAKQAASLAVDTVLEFLGQERQVGKEDRIEIAIRRAHQALLMLPHTDPGKDEPQATIAVAVCKDGVLTYGWVGDSRVYVLAQDRPTVVTQDDSWLSEALQNGVPMAEAMKQKDAHAITQCLGMRDGSPEIHVGHCPLNSGSWVLLCSDGLWNYFSDAETIALRASSEILAGNASAICGTLVSQANAAGGIDNITVAATRH